MNRQQALKYDELLSKELQDCARNSGVNETAGKNIVDNFIEFLPEDDIRVWNLQHLLADRKVFLIISNC